MNGGGCKIIKTRSNLCISNAMREIKDRLGIQVWGYNINNLFYADDTVLIAKNAADLQHILDILVVETANKRLFLK